MPMNVIIYKADWCGACKWAVPRLVQLAQMKGVEVKVIDVDKCEPNDELCKKVQAVPAIFVDGREVDIDEFVKMLGLGVKG